MNKHQIALIAIKVVLSFIKAYIFQRTQCLQNIYHWRVGSILMNDFAAFGDRRLGCTFTGIYSMVISFFRYQKPYLEFIFSYHKANDERTNSFQGSVCVWDFSGSLDRWQLH